MSRSPSPPRRGGQASIEVAPAQEESKKPKLHHELDGPNPFFKAGFITKDALKQWREIFEERPDGDRELH